ncbi:hypothetical protein BGZ80_011682 [Entomortierella chlamydospora]|uniref:Uncharacterized protein n=1 Tax=Entomortierella chlamydospora TaxID=101097 RepID=A0A9P6MSZ6_9FUNG|nr:hypothetical protein BGZ79_000120 [Entomortierella chlamydospora]KAG0012527.1 hypothetical protein BGZ80_011682 [Entomortierella chlamydospora]
MYFMAKLGGTELEQARRSREMVRILLIQHSLYSIFSADETGGYTMAAVIDQDSANIRIHIDGLRCNEKAIASAEQDKKNQEGTGFLDFALPKIVKI